MAPKLKSSGTEQFTANQMIAFAAYDRVRRSGEFNMFDPRARQATDLTKDEWIFVMKNYDALRKQHDGYKRTAP